MGRVLGYLDRRDVRKSSRPSEGGEVETEARWGVRRKWGDWGSAQQKPKAAIVAS